MFETFEFINEDFPWFFSALAAIFGALTGSFLNVCIYRIPAGRSIVFPGSTCACGRPIPFYHNIPIFSWLILRGKASCCGAPFSIRYPAIELLTAGLFLWVWMVYPPVVAAIGMLYIAFLICATFIDLDHMIIPDRFSIGGMVIGVVLSFMFPSLHGVHGLPMISNIQSGITAIVGALVGAGLVYWIAVLGEIVFRKPAMGEGDVKFVGFIGAFCGWQGAVFSMFGGALVGSAVLLPCLLVGRILAALKKNDSEVAVAEASEGTDASNDTVEEVQFGAQVPFGPMLAAAGLIYFLGFHVYVDAYFLEFVGYFFTP
ncbi:prepilin peptidase [Coraliomargarita sp. SDUM461004]|uniref:Prepilin peptidase n=1 Tax=Thalassobacterium sedimentorum TaxID=3041258 RepID=A0ABU1AJP4_9BACT|nr:prepilin peptidase [Coraliomargarita sp. SDUM461004]MDQ8195030.1 prepilin peptidase [Coraliomargarita sp. SDUM461004]